MQPVFVGESAGEIPQFLTLAESLSINQQEKWDAYFETMLSCARLALWWPLFWRLVAVPIRFVYEGLQ